MIQSVFLIKLTKRHRNKFKDDGSDNMFNSFVCIAFHLGYAYPLGSNLTLCNNICALINKIDRRATGKFDLL